MNSPIHIPADIQEKMAATQRQQAADDQIGIQAATSATPGPLKDVWAPVPDIEVGPFKVRRFVDGDFVRLSVIGHRLSSFQEVQKWLSTPNPSGEEAWILNWIMTHSVKEAKEAVKNNDKLKQDAEDQFSELGGMQLALVMRAIVEQIAVYLGTRVEYKQNEEGIPVKSLPPP